MRPNTVVWVAAVAIVVLGAAATVAGPSGLRKPSQGAPWPGLGRVDLAAGWAGSDGGASSGMNPTALYALALRTAIASQLVVEQVSPAIGADGVLVEDLGIETPPGSLLPLLERGRRSPARHIVNFSTIAAGTNEFRLHLLRGTSGKAAEAESIGWIRIGGLPPAASTGGPRAVVVFSVSDGAFLVGAASASDGRPLSIGLAESGSAAR